MFGRRFSPALRSGVATVAGAVALAACGSDLEIVESAPLPVRTCRAPASAPPFRFTDLLPGVELERPVVLAHTEDAYFIAEQAGVIRRVSRDGALTSTVFVDLNERLAQTEGEGGLVGFALSPDFPTSGEAFVFYTGKSDRPQFDTVVARITSRDGGMTADPSSLEPVLVLHREDDDGEGLHYRGHNGGQLRFGPDRLLYVGIGDGAWGDPLRRAQDPHQLFGKVLRIDVLGGRPYRVPADNPFVAGGGRPEVYAFGFRNPWSFSFDAEGRLWLADVGHERWEEINLVSPGGNYGWPLREGRHCFAPSPCELPEAIEPVHEYAHVDGFSAVAGAVYRGKALSLGGTFVFGDFMTGRIWGIDANAPGPSRLLIDSGLNIVSFAEDDDGELMLVDYAGRILRIDPGDSPAVAPGPPPTLGELGCLDPERPGEMDHGLFPYAINAELWSDGLDKRRWVSVPANAPVHVADDGSFQLPPGSMLLKEFSSGGRKIETRMLVHDAEVGWVGYTFEWNEAQSDATLLTDGKVVDVDGSPWTLPSPAQCFACHRAAAGRVLGFERVQLDRASPLSEAANQLDDLSSRGLFDRPVHPDPSTALVNPYDGAVPIEGRARAWLHANCSHCHRGAELSPSIMDLRASLSLPEMNILCRGSGDLDVGPQVLLAPGNPEQSALVARIAGDGEQRMPPLGTSRIDADALEVISSWVASLGGCE